MEYDLVRIRQTPFKVGDRIVFKATTYLKLLDIRVGVNDYFIRTAKDISNEEVQKKLTKNGFQRPHLGCWKFVRDNGNELFHLITDARIRQILGGLKSSDVIELSDEEGEKLLKKFENEEKVW